MQPVSYDVITHVYKSWTLPNICKPDDTFYIMFVKYLSMIEIIRFGPKS